MDRPDLEPVPPRVGVAAPDFLVSAVLPEGTASLADYRGTAPVMLVLNRGLWCSFCRRHLARLGATRERLRQLGIETLAIVASEPHRARLYLRHRPTPVRLAVDPTMVVHRAYGLTLPPVSGEGLAASIPVRLEDVAVNPADLSELAAAVRAAGRSPEQGLTLRDVISAQRQLYAYDMTDEEQQQWTEWTRRRVLGTGQFLIDPDGIVRWARIQNMTDPPAGFGNYPSDDDFVAAARTLGRP